MLITLGRLGEAESVYRELLAINSDNHAYHMGLLACQSYKPDAMAGEAEQEKLLQVVLVLWRGWRAVSGVVCAVYTLRSPCLRTCDESIFITSISAHLLCS